MTAFIHFMSAGETRANGADGSVSLHNVATLHDLGNRAVTVVNAFGGEPQTFSNVKNVAIQPESDDM